ncbi:DUF6185 family protein [Streptomyces sp. NPDC127110]|uniref:DUF6185 family protein n=1 Tax=Streptomyces sp. NPDC127110 TaxID=3345362 RepID=UPI0036447686
MGHDMSHGVSADPRCHHRSPAGPVQSRPAAAEGVSAGCSGRVSGYGRSVPRVKALGTGCWTRRCGRGAIVKTRWWLLLLLLISVLVGWGGAARADGAVADPCERERLKPRNVSASIDFDYHDRVYAQVTSKMTISVSADEWPPALFLASSEGSDEYQTVMRCLLRDDDDGPRNREWRYREPLVTVRGDVVTVDYEALAWIEQNRGFQVGPWKIGVDPAGEQWTVHLAPPKALDKAKWGQIEVKLNGLEAHDINPKVASADSDRLVWFDPKPLRVQVYVDPPWQRSFNVGERWGSLGWAGVASWWVFTWALIVLAVRQAARSEPSLASGPPGRGVLARVVVLWVALSAVVAVALRLAMSYPAVLGTSWRYVMAIVLGLVLVLVAQPWCHIAPLPAAQEPGADRGPVGDGGERRQVCAVTVGASMVALFCFLLVVALRPSQGTTPHLVGHALLSLATLWLWFAALAAWAWRFAREGELVPRSWNAAWERAPVRCTAVVGSLLAAAVVALFASSWWTRERQWRRAYWLIDPSGTDRAVQRMRFMKEFAYIGLAWVYAYAWLLAGIALVALLHLRVKARQARSDDVNQGVSLGPAGVDLFLMVAIFALAVGLRQVEFAGSNVLFGLWILMMVASLHAVVAAGRRVSVLGRTGEQFCTRRLGTRRRRNQLLVKAHEFRNLHHQIYSLDRGRGEGGLKREELEARLDGLHQWLFAGWGKGRPPAQISVLDAALSWGPGQDWWDNARHAARLAFCFGLPASAALVWVAYLGDARVRMSTFQSPNGLMEIAAKFGAWQVAWAGAGLVLGALWRLLPGRRSPVRALSLTAAYAIPICVGALIAQITDTELGYVFLHVALMLLVLTLTSIWMDMATFSEERKFWPSNVGLLLSVYQLRGLSTQVAYLAAQLAIVVGVWRSLAGGDSRPK